MSEGPRNGGKGARVQKNRGKEGQKRVTPEMGERIPHKGGKRGGRQA